MLGLQLTVSNVVAVVTVGAFVVGAAGIWFTARQAKIQAMAQKLSAVSETNSLWKGVGKIISEPLELSTETLETIRAIYEYCISERTSALPAEELSPTSKGAPFVFSVFFPAFDADKGTVPESETDYEREMIDRAFTFSLVMGTLVDIASGLVKDIGGGSIGAEISNRVREDLKKIELTMNRYVGELNEVAELYEQRLTPRQLFLRKRHVAIIQQAFASEPYILWRNSLGNDRWGMRVLSLGEAARTYHWKSALHNEPIFLRADPDHYGATMTYTGLGKSIGAIVAAKERGRSAESKSTRIGSRSFSAGFRPKDKLRQNVMRSNFEPTLTDSRDSISWSRLALSPEIQPSVRGITVSRSVRTGELRT